MVDALDASGAADDALHLHVTSELIRQGRFTMVLSERERTRLRELRRQSHAVNRRDDQRCALGQELSANTRLVARRVGGAGQPQQLIVGLQSIEKGCSAASVSVPWRPGAPGKSVADAVEALLASLRRPPRLPGGGIAKVDAAPVTTPVMTKPTPAARVPVVTQRPDPNAAPGRLVVQVQPPDAVITVAGTPWQRGRRASRLAPGQYQVRAQRAGFEPVLRTAVLRSNDTTTLTIRLMRPGQTGATPVTAVAPVTRPSGRYRSLGWALFGIGLASSVGGGIAMGVANGTLSQVEDGKNATVPLPQTEAMALEEDANAQWRAGVGLMVTSGALVAAGIAILLADPAPKPDDGGARATFNLQAWPVRGGGMLGTRVGF